MDFIEGVLDGKEALLAIKGLFDGSVETGVEDEPEILLVRAWWFLASERCR
jgi:hypothetical protein